MFSDAYVYVFELRKQGCLFSLTVHLQLQSIVSIVYSLLAKNNGIHISQWSSFKSLTV